jgi:hypothetical protein
MRRTIGRRSLFFGGVALVSLLMYYPTPSEFRWVALFCAALAAFWSLALALEELTGPVARGPAPEPRVEVEWADAGPETLFAPPPPPGASPPS